MSKSVATMASKNSLKGQADDTVSGTRLEREPVFIWVNPVLHFMWSKK